MCYVICKQTIAEAFPLSKECFRNRFPILYIIMLCAYIAVVSLIMCVVVLVTVC